MVKKIHINRYKKFSNIDFNFHEKINVIAGANGTCKTSLLHLISNAFQKPIYSVTPCIKIINKLNYNVNLKMENLTKGDKASNNPCGNLKGPILNIEYFDGKNLNFRKHNTKVEQRYRIIPTYSKGSSNSLPTIPVIYLGLNRLIPFGEISDNQKPKKISGNLPDEYSKEIDKKYEELTNIKISNKSYCNIENIKKRAEFKSDKDGIDSNTISSGEDNVYIILTALVSLKYYYDNSTSQGTNFPKSVLLIDELDATLHPATQIKLLRIFNDFSEKYNIQIYFTTHSLSLIEAAFENKCNIIYLIDNIHQVTPMKDPDIYKIQMHLKGMTQSNIYQGKKIPIFSEDDEARCLINLLFDYFLEQASTKEDGFNKVSSFFYLVKCKIGSENLSTIFQDTIFRRNVLMMFLSSLTSSLKRRRKTQYLSVVKEESEEEDMMILMR